MLDGDNGRLKLKKQNDSVDNFKLDLIFLINFILMANLYRTDYPKYSHYYSDGLGRDSYILKNNGGMCH